VWKVVNRGFLMLKLEVICWPVLMLIFCGTNYFINTLFCMAAGWPMRNEKNDSVLYNFVSETEIECHFIEDFTLRSDDS